MSPSESQLRAALHDGEGDSPDTNALISRALRIRRDRRRRYQAIAGAAAAAAVVGIGTSMLITLGRNNDSGSSASAARRGADVAGGALRSSAAGSPSAAAALPKAFSSTSSVAAALACPSTPDRLLLPGGGGSGQFGSTDPLFTGGVAAMKVCAYPLRAGVATRSTVLDQPEASALAKTLDAAPALSSSSSCPANPKADIGATIEIRAVNARGAALKPVVITVGCVTSKATNGTAVRYLGELPQRLVAMLASGSAKSAAGSSPAHSLPATMHGSPVR